jgi:cation transport ATPase
MAYKGKIEFAHERRIRERNTTVYRICHLPIWIWVFFLAPGPLTFSLFAHGFNRLNGLWLGVVLVCVCVAGYFAQLPGCEHGPYIIRFDEDKRNPLYRKICYTFAWNAAINFALLNLVGTIIAVATGVWYMKQIYQYAYFPILLIVLVLAALGLLPRVGRSTKREGIERRYFYGTVWSVTIAQTAVLTLWKTLPRTPTTNVVKLVVYLAVLAFMGVLAVRGVLPRTRPILPGETIAE